jgi:hypothetical protein
MYDRHLPSYGDPTSNRTSREDLAEGGNHYLATVERHGLSDMGLSDVVEPEPPVTHRETANRAAG